MMSPRPHPVLRRLHGLVRSHHLNGVEGRVQEIHENGLVVGTSDGKQVKVKPDRQEALQVE